jgi:3-oxoadipate CoA-transferase beta subunit
VSGSSARGWTREEMAARVAADIPGGSYVNLGIGIPTLVADHGAELEDVIFHSENGLLGVGPAPAPGEEDPDLINAGKTLVTMLAGGAFMSHADSFALIRGGHLDLAIMGGFEVAANGDLANWSAREAFAPAVGGAMDLAVGAKAVWVVMTHRTREGGAKCVSACSLPLTAPGVVRRVYTDLAVLTVDADHAAFNVVELAPGWSLEDLQAVTDAPVRAA